MAARIAFILLIAVVIFQVMLLDATVIRQVRDAPSANKSTTDVIQDAISSLKTSLDDIAKNIQDNQLVQNISASVKNFGEKVQAQGQELVDKIQAASKTK